MLHPCHNQSVERHIKIETETLASVSSFIKRKTNLPANKVKKANEKNSMPRVSSKVICLYVTNIMTFLHVYSLLVVSIFLFCVKPF